MCDSNLHNLCQNIRHCFSSIIGKELWGFTVGKRYKYTVVSCICFDNELHPCIEIAKQDNFHVGSKIYDSNNNMSFYHVTKDRVNDVSFDMNDYSQDCEELAYNNYNDVILRISTDHTIYDIRTYFPVDYYPYFGNHHISDNTSMRKE